MWALCSALNRTYLLQLLALWEVPFHHPIHGRAFLAVLLA
jgi:hypothetical protein